MYTSQGTQVMFSGELRAVTPDAATAKAAVQMLNEARYLNNHKRQYTNAARLIAKVEALSGFGWV
jgi:hypothetical protein